MAIVWPKRLWYKRLEHGSGFFISLWTVLLLQACKTAKKRRERKWIAWGSVLCREFAQKRPGYENCEKKHCRKEGRRLSEQFSKPVPSLHSDITAAAARSVGLLAMSANSSMCVLCSNTTAASHSRAQSQSLLEFCAGGPIFSAKWHFKPRSVLGEKVLDPSCPVFT